MPSPSPAAISSPAIRDAIAFTRFPWIRPLLDAYVNDFASVARLFPGDPASTDAWQKTIALAQAGARHRPLMVDVLGAQLARRNAPPPAREAAARLGDAHSVAVVTGQQAGLFGGPLYTVLKAVTAVQLARDVTARHGVPAVGVFWVDAEDHDWEEIRAAQCLDRDGNVATLTLPNLAGSGHLPAGRLVLDDRITGILGSLESLLPPTEFTSEILALLRRRYAPGVSMGTAFAGWLDDLLGSEGLVVFESDDPAAKAAAVSIFSCEVERPARVSSLVRQAGDEMRRLGHEPQIEPSDDTVCLFYLDSDGRRSIRWHGDRFVCGPTTWSPQELRAEISAYPVRFSPNVALRPLVQDVLFPTVCYVAGPSELAYQAQLGQAYADCGVAQPLLYSRASATVLDSAAARFLERSQLPFEALQPQDEAALNRVLEDALPPDIDRAFQDMARTVAAEAARLKEAVTGIDSTLAGAVDTTSERVADTLHTLHNKIIHAAKRKDETVRRQFTRARALTFPDGHPQERVLSLAFFANRYGPAFASRLIDVLPHSTDKHYLVVI